MRLYPTIRTALEYDSAWQLLVVTVLSAQTTDDNVNKVAPELFQRYPTPSDLAGARHADVEKIVYSTGFYRQKSAALIDLATDLVMRFDGKVPKTLEELTTLKGVGRKTASVVLAEVWDLPAIAVDTHVKRVTHRLGITPTNDAVKIEHDLKALYPMKHWSGLSMRFIQFGRDICDAKNPRCAECVMVRICPFPDKRL